MSSLWYPHVKEAPLQGLTGMWGGVSSNLIGGSGPIEQGTITELYNAANESGIQTVVMNDGSSTRSLNFTRWSDKGWVEIMFAGNVPYGWHNSTGFYQSYDGGYGLNTFNESGSGNTMGLNYSQAGSQLMLGNNITTTDIVFTTKSSKSLAQINPPTGENQNSAYPLRMSASIGGAGTQQSASKTAMLQYFRGTRKGFTFYQTAGTNSDTFSGYWDKGGLSFGMLLHSRDGSAQLDHWYVASGNTNSGGTYYANIGFRGTTGGGSYDSKYTGAWYDHTSVTDSAYLMANDNVFSVWVTDM
tara:strand:- start:274 stop:1173 length:900 start_codon:yes stop_codon:yes gene_type:complete